MRDVAFTILMAILLPACYRRPLVGILTFSWLAYMRPQDLTWGFAKYQRWSFLVAGITLVGYFASKHKGRMVWNGRAWAMLGLIATVGLSLVFSDATAKWAIPRYVEYIKIIGVSLFTIVLVRKPEHLRILLFTIALSFGFYGVKIGVAGILSGGSLSVMQGPGGMLEDNNDFAVALNMGLPMLLQIGASERNPKLKRWFYVIVPLQIIAILLTRSRGGALALGVQSLILIWRSKNRGTAAVALVIAGIIGSFAVPQSFYDRMRTLGDVGSDGSAMGRIAAWYTARNMIVANPAFGVGLGSFQANYRRYRSGLANEQARATHNAYLQIWAECGTFSFLLYMTLIFGSFFAIWRLRAEAKRKYKESWILNYCAMFEASLMAFAIGSLFVNRAHFDLFYHLVAIIMSFELLARREMRGETTSLARLAGRGDWKLVPRHGFERPERRGGFRDGPAIGQPV